MLVTPNSGKTIPNKVARVYLDASQEVLGVNGVAAVLNYSRLSHWIASPPPDDMRRQVDYAEFSRLHAAFERIYGARAGDNLSRRSGTATFKRIRDSLGPLRGLVTIAQRALPAERKIGLILPVLARVFTQISDQQCEVSSSDEALFYTIVNCPICWGRSADRVVCHTTVGVLHEALLWINNRQPVWIREVACSARGDAFCRFEIRSSVGDGR